MSDWRNNIFSHNAQWNHSVKLYLWRCYRQFITSVRRLFVFFGGEFFLLFLFLPKKRGSCKQCPIVSHKENVNVSLRHRNETMANLLCVHTGNVGNPNFCPDNNPIFIYICYHFLERKLVVNYHQTFCSSIQKLFVRSFIYSFIHSYIHSFIHSYIHVCYGYVKF